MDNGVQHYIFMYVYIHCFNWISRLDLRVVLLSRRLLNFLKTFAGLIWNSFFEFGKILPHPDNHFLPRGRELDKKIVRVAGISSLKKQKIFPGVAGGDVPSWNWLRQYGH